MAAGSEPVNVVDRGPLAGADPDDAVAAHQLRDRLARDDLTGLAQVRQDPRRAVDPVGGGVAATDLLGQCRARAAAPRLGPAACRAAQS